MYGKGNIGYHNDILGSDEGMKNTDSAEFLRLLQKFYKVEKREEIGELLKKDIRKEQSYRTLVDFLGYTDEEFSVSLVVLFSDILNKPILGYLRSYVSGKKLARPVVAARPKRSTRKLKKK